MNKSINNRRREQMERRRWFFGTIFLFILVTGFLTANLKIERGDFREAASSMREWNEARAERLYK